MFLLHPLLLPQVGKCLSTQMTSMSRVGSHADGQKDIISPCNTEYSLSKLGKSGMLTLTALPLALVAHCTLHLLQVHRVCGTGQILQRGSFLLDLSG